MRVHICLAVASAIMLSSTSQPVAAQSELEIAFDPTIVVLELRYQDPWSGHLTTYRLMGDGTFTEESTDRKRKTVGKRSISLSYEETLSLVQIAVNHGLAESSEERIREKAGGKLLKVSDGTRSTIRVRLERLGDRTNVRNEITIVGPAYLAPRYPDISEIQGFQALAVRLREITNRMEVDEP